MALTLEGHVNGADFRRSCYVLHVRYVNVHITDYIFVLRNMIWECTCYGLLIPAEGGVSAVKKTDEPLKIRWASPLSELTMALCLENFI